MMDNNIYLTIFILLCSTSVNNEPLCQPARTPLSMQHAVVQVKLYNEGREVGVGAGMKYRSTNDSLYILTAKHLINNAPFDEETLTISFTFRYGTTYTTSDYSIIEFSGVDLALVAFSGLERFPGENNYVRVRTRLPDTGEDVYILGCMNTNCWNYPVRGRVTAADNTTIRVASPYLLPGLSGGLVVDEAGRVRGILTSANTGIAIVTPISKVRTLDSPRMNLGDNFSELKVGESHLFINVQSLPLPAKGKNGNRLLPGFSLKLNARVDPCCSVGAFYDRYTATGIATEHRVLSISRGFLLNFHQPAFSYRNRAAEFFLLFAPVFVEETFLIKSKRIDRVDLSTGEPEYVEDFALKKTSGIRVVLGLGARYKLSRNVVLQSSVRTHLPYLLKFSTTGVSQQYVFPLNFSINIGIGINVL